MALDRGRERAAFSARGRKYYGCISVVVGLLSALAHASPQKLCARRCLSLQRGYPILIIYGRTGAEGDTAATTGSFESAHRTLRLDTRCTTSRLPRNLSEFP